MSENYIGEQRVARVVIACAQTKLNSDWLIRVHFRLRAGYSSESTRLPLQCGLGSSPGVDTIFGLSLLMVLSVAPRGFFPGTSEENSQHLQILIRS